MIPDDNRPSMPLLGELVSALAASDAAELERLFAAHADEIVAAFPYWRGLLPGEAEQKDGWARLLVSIALLFEQLLGRRDLLDRLAGPMPDAAPSPIMGASDAEIAAYLDALRRLRPDDLRRARGNAAAAGVGDSAAYAVATSVLLSIVKGHHAEDLLDEQIGAAYQALRAIPARLDFQLAKGLAVVAEALFVRDELDPKSWATLTSTVAGVIDLPAQDPNRAPAAVALAEHRRSALEADQVRLFRMTTVHAEIQREGQEGRRPRDS